MAQKPVTDVSVTYSVALITVDNLPNDMLIISEIFRRIAQQNINIDMISQAPPYMGNISLSFSIPSQDIVSAITTLNQFKSVVPDLHIEVDADNTKISIYGKEMKNIPGVAANLFTIMASNGIEIKLVTTSEVDISYLILEKDVDLATEKIKEEYKI
ncbi:MAG: ACT domain-containing protein [Clostridia bacterium]|jgi:aspartokinase